MSNDVNLTYDGGWKILNDIHWILWAIMSIFVFFMVVFLVFAVGIENSLKENNRILKEQVKLQQEQLDKVVKSLQVIEVIQYKKDQKL
jgi:uncharacterized protein YneF (UPF0154 family)